VVESARPSPEPGGIELGNPPAAEFARTRADLADFARGDPLAFENLWRRYRPALEVLVAGKVRQGVDSLLRARLDAEIEDVLQEASLTIHAKLGGFEYRGAGSLLAWMARIATRVVQDRVDYWRAEKRAAGEIAIRSDSSDAGTAPVPALVAREPGPRTEVELGDQRRRVGAALAALSERHHTILFWRFFGGADWDEIAREVGSPSPDAMRMECYGKALPALAAALAKS